MKIAIIGSGITGLTAALNLAKSGHEVHIFEKSEKIGGIAETFDYHNYTLEKYYHHYFKSDENIIKLLNELNLDNDIRWLQSVMGYFTDNKMWDFGTPISLLKFKPLNFIDKIRFGISVLKIFSINKWSSLENITAKDWIIKNAGENVYKKVWRPLLITKFGDEHEDISMVWLWGKMKLRGKSKDNGKEVLGYISGSNKTLLLKIVDKLQELGVKIHLNKEVKALNKNDTFEIVTKTANYNFDKVISTVSLPASLGIGQSILPKDYIKEKSRINYTATVCLILILKKTFSKYYWLNIGDESIPFGGLIEHTNLISPEEYGGDHILYISNYVFKNSKYYKMTKQELVKAYTAYLKKINPDYSEDWIIDSFIFKDDFAQPVIKNNYSKIKPDFKTPVDGFFVANMCNIYPEDRGVNYAIRDGIKVAEEVLK